MSNVEEKKEKKKRNINSLTQYIILNNLVMLLCPESKTLTSSTNIKDIFDQKKNILKTCRTNSGHKRIYKLQYQCAATKHQN